MEWTTLAVAGMSLIGTLAGTFGGILVSNKLTTYRIEQLEAKVAAHNSLVERTYKLEGQMTEVQHDIRDLKAEMGRGVGAASKALGQSADHQKPSDADPHRGVRLSHRLRQRHRRGVFDGVHGGDRLLLRHTGGEKRQQGRLTAAGLRCFETRKGNAP